MLRNLTNQFYFTLRNSITFSRKLKGITNQDKTGLFPDKPEQDLEKGLLDSYNFYSFYDNSTITSYKENLYIIKLLQDIFSAENIYIESYNIRILDIGSRNFSYAASLHHFFSYHNTQKKTRTIHLDGIEIDPNRLMADLHTRKDYANYYIKNLTNTHYLTENFLNYNTKQYNFITWFLPFLTKKPILSWGLPLNYLQPSLMIEHAYNLLASDGYMIIANQSLEEAKIQIDLLNQQNIYHKQIYTEYTNSFTPFRNKRSIILVKKLDKR